MANGPGEVHLFLILLIVVLWWPLFELSAAVTLVILSGLVLWFDGTAFNFIRLGVEFRGYPSQLATPQWANRKAFQRVRRPFSRRRYRTRVLMSKNLRGNFPWKTASEPSQAVPNPKPNQDRAARDVAVEQQAAAATARQKEFLSAGEEIFAGLQESAQAHLTATYEKSKLPSDGITLAHILGAVSALKQWVHQDNSVRTDLSWQRDSVTMWHKRKRVSCHALRPGSPARQGASHE
jgi:hypothetical protein